MRIHETKEYSKFKHLKGNRTLKPLPLKRLMLSMKDNFLVKPIDINEKYEIIDGQHRFEVCKKLNKPIYYLIHNGWGIKEAQILNANQKQWTTQDYLDGYYDLGLEDYISLKDRLELYNDFTFNTVFGLSMGRTFKPSGNDVISFQNGDYKIDNSFPINFVLDYIRSLGEYHPNYNRSYFVWAIVKLMSNDEFNSDLFKRKLKYQGSKLVECGSEKEYIKLIESIYNFKSRKPVRFY